MTIINWLNDNDGATMAVLTFVYVIATWFICSYNCKAAKATEEQTKESKRQFKENCRARIVPKFIVLEGQIYCLTFENVGHAFASHVRIDISQDWIDCLKTAVRFPSTAYDLEKLRTQDIFFCEGDIRAYQLCVCGDNTGDFEKLEKAFLKIEISYKTNGEFYSKESYQIQLGVAEGLANVSDYVRMEKHKRESLDKIANELKRIHQQKENSVSPEEAIAYKNLLLQKVIEIENEGTSNNTTSE